MVHFIVITNQNIQEFNLISRSDWQRDCRPTSCSQ